MADNIPRVMIVDDEAELRKILSTIVEDEGFKSVSAADGNMALKLLHSEKPDAVITDVRMPGLDGFELLKKIKAFDADIPVIILTAFSDVQQAVTAMREGAHDYLSKPFDNLEVVRVIRRALNEKVLKKNIRHLSDKLEERLSLAESMGPSERVSRLTMDIERVAKSDFTVVIVGETGVGKELIAKAIHKASSRSGGPFIPVDCGAIPENLLESELFGHEKGSFTGADVQKQGKFEMAQKGTLFMDEVSNLPLSSQAKILRLIQDKKLNRVGSVKSIDVDIRLIAATNMDLSDMKNQGKFRKDLYYRLSEYTIYVPPLRERRDDIVFLAKRFLDQANIDLKKSVSGFSRPALEAILTHSWPGNVRQLKSVIRRATLIAGETITEDDLSLGMVAQQSREEGEGAISSHTLNGMSLGEIVQKSTIAVEREVIAAALKQTGGNKAKAARLLRIDYKTMHTKAKKYGIKE